MQQCVLTALALVLAHAEDAVSPTTVTLARPSSNLLQVGSGLLLPPGGPDAPSPEYGRTRQFLANLSIDLGDVPLPVGIELHSLTFFLLLFFLATVRALQHAPNTITEHRFRSPARRVSEAAHHVAQTRASACLNVLNSLSLSLSRSLC